MKKLKLNPDTLRVETFPTGAPTVAFGTVNGHEIPTVVASVCIALCPPTYALQD